MRASTRKGQLSIIHHVISFLHIEPLEFQYSVLNLRKLKNYDHTELCIICIIFIFMVFFGLELFIHCNDECTHAASERKYYMD